MIARLARLAAMAALIGLVTPALAQQIPALVDLPSDFAAARPDLVSRRATLMQERTSLRAKFDSHNARCSNVQEGSAQEATCRSAQGTLASNLGAHVRKTNEFNSGTRAGISAAAKPKPVAVPADAPQPRASTARYSPDHIVVPSPPIVPECTGAACTLERIDQKASQFLWDRRVWLNDPAHRGWVGDAINFILFPGAVSGVVEGIGAELAINGSSVGSAAAKAKGTINYVFRGDKETPIGFLKEGFFARGTSTDLLAHAMNNQNPPSAFIATSYSPEIAAQFGSGKYVYVIKQPEHAVDVNRVLGAKSPYSWEMESAIPWHVPPSDLRGVTFPQKGFSYINPHFGE
jgi:hypothetical protein